MSFDMNEEEKINQKFTKCLRRNKKGLTVKEVKVALREILLDYKSITQGYNEDSIAKEAISNFGLKNPGIIQQDEFTQLIEFFVQEKGGLLRLS